MDQNIYVISGLGADHTVFGKLDLTGYQLIHIKWVKTTIGESMSDYAKKLLPQIKEDNPILLGLSLGGMIALEVANLIPTKKVISLSSIVSYSELPLYFKFAGWLRLQKFLPIYYFSKGNRFTQSIFGVKAKDDREILNQVFEKLEKDFLYWALNAVLNWKSPSVPTHLKRIHGTADLIIRKRRKSAYDAIIPKGTHLMLLAQPEKVSKAILNELKT